MALTVPQFADRWCIGITSVYADIKRGELESIKVGKRRLIPLEAEDRWLERKGYNGRGQQTV